MEGADPAITANNDLQQPLITETSKPTTNTKPTQSNNSETITPYANSSIFSLLTFSWLSPLISIGHNKPLDLHDIPQLSHPDSVTGSFPIFRHKLDRDHHKKLTVFELVIALIHTTWKDILITAILAILYTFASYVGPYLIDSFVKFLNGPQDSKYEGYLFVFVFFLAKVVESVTQRHWFFKLQQGGIRVRGALVAMIYEKSLTVSSRSKLGRSSGEVTNFVAVDAERIGEFGWYVHDPWLVIVQVGLALAILYLNLGFASVSALVAIVIVMLPNVPLGNLQQKFQAELMTAKDERMKTTLEMLKNMRRETGWLKRYLATSATILSVFWVSPTFVAVVTFGTCMIVGIPLESGKILSAVATFKILQQPIYNLPDTVAMIAQTKVSLDHVAIEITNGSFSWDGLSAESVLNDINVKVHHGMKVAVCGTVGSGKSSFLSCILGEVGKVSGSVKLSGTTAYVAQSPWIQSGTIEENVLFGKDMDALRYDKVLEACALKKDLEFAAVWRSNGYRRTGNQSEWWAETEECLMGFLESKTVVYVTHQVEFLPVADLILQFFSSYFKLLAITGWLGPRLSEGEVPPVSGSTLITIYVFLAIGSTVCIFGRAMSLTVAGYKTAKILFEKMHLCIFRAPMAFFDATPSGRILNRASTDQNAVDLTIPNAVGVFVFAVIQLLAVIAIMSQISWQVFLVFVPVIASCIWLQEFSSRRKISNTNMKLVDGYSRPNFHSSAAREWLSFRVEMLASVTFAAFLIFLLVIPNGTIDPSIAGLAVTYGLNLNILQASVIWKLSNMENTIISVERIFQYMSIPSEGSLVLESNRPNDLWPSHGKIDISNLQVRYASHMPLVLRGLTCTFHGGKRTGIVGRTGSGKSTLIQTLFRIVEPTVGAILIDGIDISTIGLHDLRSRLSIIPQDPTMFQGTVRSNLDPLDQFTDEEVWEALDKCQLGDEVRKKERKLDSTVDENGENWSMGQRQLVCLARVLLKKSKILVLDEATASVDTSTDNMIQQTLEHHFSDSTIVTIAHRITSVLNGHMVLVLEQGLIEEYDSPLKLLENKSSSFAKLVAEYRGRSSSSYVKVT
ncbi:hypothetical protein OSB04_008473 [Centaurea solstitialis]|uniref:ABC-type xenobiotic transporter n=1 Tax=Centaurea solstitialis TaxID=347529 RepID=A0AA38TUE3_9ASTR|nr:hypothetical protein OSB04_008473 [Centaurea solstitialis]